MKNVGIVSLDLGSLHWGHLVPAADFCLPYIARSAESQIPKPRTQKNGEVHTCTYAGYFYILGLSEGAGLLYFTPHEQTD